MSFISSLTLLLLVGLFIGITSEGKYRQWRGRIGFIALLIGITYFLLDLLVYSCGSSMQIGSLSFSFFLVWIVASVLMLLGMLLTSSDSRWLGPLALGFFFASILTSYGQAVGDACANPLLVWVTILWYGSWLLIAILEPFKGDLSIEEETTEEGTDE